MTKYSGGCACGAVRYETDADPIMAGHCQCRKCQTLSGAGHMTFAAFPAAAVKVTGQLVPWSYTADSGNTATRNRCAVCGTQVTGGNSGMKELMGLNLTTMDDASAITPGMVFFHANARPWDLLDPALPTFPGMPPM